MTIQFSTALRNARLNTIESHIGVDAILKIRTGAQPANVAAADSGSVLVTIQLPTDWMAAAAGGAVSKTGTWQELTADASGTAGHWRLYEDDGTTCHAQGSCSVSGGGGDLELDDVDILVDGTVTITSWTLTEGNP